MKKRADMKVRVKFYSTVRFNCKVHSFSNWLNIQILSFSSLVLSSLVVYWIILTFS